MLWPTYQVIFQNISLHSKVSSTISKYVIYPKPFFLIPAIYASLSKPKSPLTLTQPYQIVMSISSMDNERFKLLLVPVSFMMSQSATLTSMLSVCGNDALLQHYASAFFPYLYYPPIMDPINFHTTSLDTRMHALRLLYSGSISRPCICICLSFRVLITRIQQSSNWHLHHNLHCTTRMCLSHRV